MNTLIIGFDTSNYRTSTAVVSTAGEVLYNGRLLLPVAAGERGLRQSDAVFAHLKQLPAVTEDIRPIMTGKQVGAVIASTRPRNREDSYMPVFQVGERFGMSLADILNVPFLKTDHQSGHLAAAVHGTMLEKENRYLAFHLSGGTTDFLDVKDGKAVEIGGSLDLHAGQLVDRTGVALGLGFPAGPELEALAVKGKSDASLGVSLEQGDLFCHLSGAESQTARWIRDGEKSPEDIAAEVYDLLARTIARMAVSGSKRTGVRNILAAGGVSASPLFRRLLVQRTEKICKGIQFVFGQEELSGDNAVGVALIGARKLRETEVSYVSKDP